MVEKTSTLVFVYGSLKRGYGNNRLLHAGRAEFVSEAQTVPKFKLYERGIPYMRRAEANQEGLAIRGEIWRVSPENLLRLDALEGHPNYYTRTEIEVYKTKVFWEKEYTDRLVTPVQAYLYNHPISDGMTDSGIVYVSPYDRDEDDDDDDEDYDHDED